MKKKGFTLVELLSVVVIIAVLAVLIVPNVINMVIEGKKKILIVEEQQILVSSNLYLEDYCIHPLKGNTCQKRNHMYYIGDINGDGKVNSYDSIMLFRYVGNTLEDENIIKIIKERADLNEDGKINGEDVSLLQSLVGSGNEKSVEKVYFCLSEIKDKKYVENTELISGIECSGFIEYTYNEGKYTKGKTYVQCADEYQTEGIENRITQEGKYAIEECGGTKPGEEIEIPTTPGDEKLVEVTLDAQGGNVNPQKIEVVLNENYSILPEATKEGYTFIGWYTDDGVKITNETKVIIETEHTLYARYSSKVLHVVFHSNRYEGDDYTAEQDFVYLQSGNRFGYNTDGNPKWDQTGQFGSWNYTGHTLLGWSKQKNAYTQTYTPYNNVTDEWIIKNDSPVDLYAVWVENSASYLEKVQGTQSGESNFLSTEIKRKDINSITFTNKISGHSVSNTNTWDVGQIKNGTVLAWTTGTTNGRYDLVIGQVGGVIANVDSYGLFSNLTQAVSITFNNNFDTSNVINMRDMFRNCIKLESLDLSNFNTENVKSMFQMFRHCESIQQLDVSSFESKQNEMDLAGMFMYCYELQNIVFGKDKDGYNKLLNSNVKYTYNMFLSNKELQQLDLNKVNTSNVTDMNGMFNECTEFTSLDLRSFDTSNTIYMYNLFRNCIKLENIYFGDNFKTSNVTNMYGMFLGCKSIISLNLSGFDTSNVTDMGGMFAQCYKLKELNISSFNTSSLTSTTYHFEEYNSQPEHWYGMFDGCEELTTIFVSESWNMSNVTESQNMFLGCTSLIGGSGTSYDSNHIDKEYARINTETTPGYLSTISSVKVVFHRTTAVGDTTVEQTFEYGRSEKHFADTGFTLNGYALTGWKKENSDYIYGVNSNVKNSWILNNKPEVHLYAAWEEKNTCNPEHSCPNGGTLTNDATYGWICLTGYTEREGPGICHKIISDCDECGGWAVAPVCDYQTCANLCALCGSEPDCDYDACYDDCWDAGWCQPGTCKSCSQSYECIKDYSSCDIDGYDVLPGSNYEKCYQDAMSCNGYRLTVNPNGGTWNGSTEIKEIEQDPNTTITIQNPIVPTYTITYNGNSQGATFSPSSQSVLGVFNGWNRTGKGALNDTTFTYGVGNASLTAKYSSSEFTLPTITKAGKICSWAEGSPSGTKYTGGRTLIVSENTTYYVSCGIALRQVNYDTSNNEYKFIYNGQIQIATNKRVYENGSWIYKFVPETTGIDVDPGSPFIYDSTNNTYRFIYNGQIQIATNKRVYENGSWIYKFVPETTGIDVDPGSPILYDSTNNTYKFIYNGQIQIATYERVYENGSWIYKFVPETTGIDVDLGSQFEYVSNNDSYKCIHNGQLHSATYQRVYENGSWKYKYISETIGIDVDPATPFIYDSTNNTYKYIYNGRIQKATYERVKENGSWIYKFVPETTGIDVDPGSSILYDSTNNVYRYIYNNQIQKATYERVKENGSWIYKFIPETTGIDVD